MNLYLNLIVFSFLIVNIVGLSCKRNTKKRCIGQIIIPNFKGESGAPGPPGPMGATGEQGEEGPTGAKGDTGPKGDEGMKGDTGVKGPTGDNGLEGLTGPKGDKGELGPIGPIGANGPPGIQGANGTAGQKGATGYGAPGQNGAIGPQGPAGLRGQAGPKGETGIIGQKGDPGVLPSTILSAMNDQLSSDTAENSDPMLYISMTISVLSIMITILVVIAGLVWIIKHKGTIKTNSDDIELSSNKASNITTHGIVNNQCYGIIGQKQTEKAAEPCYEEINFKNTKNKRND